MTTPTRMIASRITTATTMMAGMEVAPSVMCCVLLTVVVASVVNAVKVSQNVVCRKMNRHVSASLGLQYS